MMKEDTEMITAEQITQWQTGGAVHNAHLSALLPAGLKAATERAAEEEGWSLSHLVRTALLDRLRNHHPHLIEGGG